MHKAASSVLLLFLLVNAPSVLAQAPQEVHPKLPPPEEAASSEGPETSASSPAAVVRADVDGFELAAPDESFVLQLRGDVQADGRFFADEEVAPGNESFYLRRVRMVFQGTVLSRFDFKIMPNFGMGRAELQDAYLDARFSKSLGLRAGKFKVPVGLELLQSPTSMAFIERGLPTALVPNRDVGVILHGNLVNGKLLYEIGAFNGSPDGASIDADLNNSKDVTGRLFLTPFKGSTSVLTGLGFGIAASTGVREGTEDASELPSYRTSGRQTFFRYASDSAALMSDGRHDRIVPQGYLYVGPVGLLGEYVLSRQHVRGTETATLNHSAWLISGSYVLTGEDASHGRLQPRRPYDGAGGWGALALHARIHALSLDPDTFPSYASASGSAASARSWAVGLSWYPNGNVRLSVNFEQTRFGAADGAERRSTENLILTRMQIAF